MTATKKHIPGKRIKSLHRSARKVGVVNPLKSFAHALALTEALPGHETARRWLDGKRVRYEVAS